MFCEHGLTKETCPYCMQQSRIKPPTRLVKLAPTELPMEVPLIKDLQNPTSPIKELYKENSPVNIKSRQLEKKFSLNMDSNEYNKTLFDKRMTELEKLRGYSTNSEDITPNVQIFDLKKKFTKK
ncbi:hypothetical protein DSAG12_01285 [Promethearchaeum syntrophicum]|uniref:Uncharacterized protein n=1 Tax=Promethearchaeum syntrophicum TaxID=2594042 RepID=A0A5B9D8J3_9ARCH|nr:hypothetical protein [Candidatus Prometheoarchaeum syntrophicum]QEE15459.1 hypothetical protein DSAG12_01285 [Candidatus Prometheoarchaeum syntrophicum]